MEEVAFAGLAAAKVMELTLKFELFRFELSATLPPAQTCAGVAEGVKEAPSITPTLNVPLTDPHPVTVLLKVYCVVVAGEAVVSKELVDDSPVDGVQLKLLPLVTFAVRSTDPPAEQMSPFSGLEVIKDRTVKLAGNRLLEQELLNVST